MTGLAAVPEQTLVDRALERLSLGPCSAADLSREVLGLPNAPVAVAERIAVALLGADPRVRQLEDGRWSAIAVAGTSPLIEECAFAVLDVETTGSRPSEDDRVTEVAVVVVQGERRELVFDSLVNPGRHIPPWITEMTGISDVTVAGAPAFEAVADPLLQALSGRVFTAHNARFDWGFVSAEFSRTRGLQLVGPRLCTVRLARALLPELPSRGLDALMQHFGIENGSRHRAAGDALATAEVLGRLILLARDRNARTWADLEAMAALGRRSGKR